MLDKWDLSIVKVNMFISPSQLLPSAPGKAERTRQRILHSALTLFTSIGYEQTTLRHIAASAGTSLGLTYRYFSCKEELVLAFYNGLASRFIEHVQQLSSGTLADRFEAAILYKLDLIEPHQDLIGVLLSSAVNPKSPIGVLGEQTANIRRRMQIAFEQIVEGSQDAPAAALAQRLATLLYMTHLALLFFRVHDRSEAGKATRGLVDLIKPGLAFSPFALQIPIVSDGMEKLAASFAAVLGANNHESAPNSAAT